LAGPEAAEQLVSEEWQFQLTPYLWALALDGDVTVKGVKSSPSVSFREIVDNLDYALMVEGEARKGRIGLYANAIYADLSDTDKVSGVRIRADAQTVWAGAGAFYRLGPWELLPKAGPSGPKVVVDPYAGRSCHRSERQAQDQERRTAGRSGQELGGPGHRRQSFGS